jgi:hypothetical protein
MPASTVLAPVSISCLPIVCKTESFGGLLPIFYFSVVESALFSVRIRIRIRIQLFISVRIGIQVAQLMLIRILVRLYIHKKLNTVLEHNQEEGT